MVKPNTSSFITKLTKKIITKEDLIFLLEEINIIERLIFKNINIPLSKKTEGKINKDLTKELQELEKKKIISKKPEEDKVFFEKVKKHFQNIPQIKLATAFRPKREFINEISLWLEEKINQKIILDLTFNPEIAGGIVIEYKGKRIDLSLIEEIKSLLKP